MRSGIAVGSRSIRTTGSTSPGRTTTAGRSPTSAGGPIGIEDSGIGVVETPYNFWLINRGNQAIGSRGDRLFDGPLATGEDGYEHDRVRWERDGVLTIPMTVADGAGEYGTGYALRDYVLREE